MKRLLVFALFAAVAGAPGCARSPSEERYVRTIEDWRAGRIARLQKPDGWLSLAGLAWLKPGENPVGSDPSSSVVLPASAPAHVGAIVLEEGKARWIPAPGSAAAVGGAPAAAMPLVDDADGGSEPTMLRIGSVSFAVIRRGERMGVRVRDSDAPTRTGFRGLEHYPVHSRWRFEARFVPFTPEKHIPVPTVLGYPEEDVSPGEIEFVRNGKPYRLTTVLEKGSDQLFIIFGDRTNGKSTYGGGRFVYSPMPTDGKTVIDFNKSYNPPCVFTPYATCPLPPPGNHLPIAVEAGEKMYAESWELSKHS